MSAEVLEDSPDRSTPSDNVSILPRLAGGETLLLKIKANKTNKKQRQNNEINRNCTMVAVLNSLKLNEYNNNICKSFEEIKNKTNNNLLGIYFQL